MMLVYNYYTVGEQKILQKKSAILFGRRSNTMTKEYAFLGISIGQNLRHCFSQF